MRVLASSLVLLSVVSACGNDAAEPAPVAFEEEAEACRQRWGRLARTLANLRIQDSSVEVPEGLELPVQSGGEVAHGPELVVGVDATSFVGRPAASTAELGGFLDEAKQRMQAMAARTGSPSVGRVVAMIDRRAPVSRAQPVLAAALDRDFEISLAFFLEGTSAPPSRPPPPAWAAPAVQNARARNRDGSVSDAFRRAADGCPAMTTMGTLAVTHGAGQAYSMLGVSMAAAPEACGCEGVDVDAFEALLVASLEARTPEVHHAPFPLSHSADATELSLAPTATGADLARAVRAVPPDTARIRLGR